MINKDIEESRQTLIYGPPGTGKTTFACSGEPPIALIDIDLKAQNQRNIKEKVDTGLVDIYPLKCRLIQGDDLDYIINPGTPRLQPEGYTTFVSLLQYIINKAPKAYSTIVIDSGTRLIQHLTHLTTAVNAKSQMTQTLWGIFYNELANRLNRLQMIPIHFVWIFHERITEDKANDDLKVHPSIPGQMGTDIAGFFNEVYHTRVAQIQGGRYYYCITACEGKYVARTSGSLEFEEKQDLMYIIQKLRT